MRAAGRTAPGPEAPSRRAGRPSEQGSVGATKRRRCSHTPTAPCPRPRGKGSADPGGGGEPRLPSRCPLSPHRTVTPTRASSSLGAAFLPMVPEGTIPAAQRRACFTHTQLRQAPPHTRWPPPLSQPGWRAQGPQLRGQATAAVLTLGRAQFNCGVPFPHRRGQCSWRVGDIRKFNEIIYVQDPTCK